MRGALVLAVAGIALAAAPAGAQEPSVRAEVDARRIGVGEQVQLTIVVEGRAELAAPVTVPPLKNLRAVGGPFQSTQVSFVNGAMSQTLSVTYVLQPLAVGRAEIGAAQVKLAGGEKATAPIAIEVVAGSVRPQRPQQQRGPIDPFGEDPFAGMFGRGRPRAEPKILITAIASRSRAHVGEPIVVTYFLYTQASVASVQLSTAPQYPGFWTEDLDQGRSGPQGERATLGGENYARFAVARKLLFPTRAGTLTIPEATFRVTLARMSVFDAGGAADRTTQPLTITADPIPTAPDFSGAVGEFQVSAALDRTAVGLGEAATLRFTVAGTGNLKWVERAPELALPGARVYPPQVRSDLTVGLDGMKGSRTWEFVIVPETGGTLTVPPLSFTYFAPASNSLKRVQTAPLTLAVQGGGIAPAGGVLPLPRGALAGAPVLRSDLDLPGRSLPELGAGAVLAALGLALLLHAGIAAGGQWSQRKATAQGRLAPRHSVRRALSELDQARRGGLSKEEAAALIERTLHGVFGDVGDNGAGPAGERERAIRDVLQQVQFIRYAPQLGDYSEQISSVAARAADLVRRWA